MKASQFLRLIIPLFCFIACADKKPAEDIYNNAKDTSVAANAAAAKDTFETGKIIPHVFCKNNAAQSYALYIPAKGDSEALPAIYFFDPHGDGSLPLNKYKTLADTYNFILIGSNNSKNGNDFSAAENIWQNLFNDSQKRLKINSSRIYVCGFSGGAKVASYLALNNHEIKAVIAGGAGLPDGTVAGNFNFSFTAIAGYGDMNMTDLVSINSDFDKTQTKHRIIFFNGKHEWSPESIMNIAFAGLQFDAMKEKIIREDDNFINNYITNSKKRIESFSASGDFINAEKECKLSINLLNGVTNEVSWFKEKDASIINNTAYRKQWQAQQNLLITEQNIKAGYQQQFQQGDINYWTKTISDLQIKSKAQTAEGAMYQRLLAYLSLAFYSISNQLINNNQNDAAKYFDELYKMADSTNSEAWYFSAILNARNNNAKATENDLLKAVENGFIDENRMMQQPEFQNLLSQINFAMIEKKMKKAE